MITAGDEYPIHQAALPIAWPTQSDRNFYDRSYLCAHDRSGEIFVDEPVRAQALGCIERMLDFTAKHPGSISKTGFVRHIGPA